MDGCLIGHHRLVIHLISSPLSFDYLIGPVYIPHKIEVVCIFQLNRGVGDILIAYESFSVFFFLAKYMVENHRTIPIKKAAAPAIIDPKI